MIIVKRSLKEADDGYKALQNYSATPLANGFSPVEIIINRRIRTSLPMFTLYFPDLIVLRKKEEKRRNRQKQDYGHHHGA